MVPIQSYWNTPNKTTLTTASVVKTLPEVTGLKQILCYFADKDGTSVDTIHGGVGTRAKQKVTKDEQSRRVSLQQRQLQRKPVVANLLLHLTAEFLKLKGQ